MIEIGLAFVNNLKVLAIVIAAFSGIISVVAFGISLESPTRYDSDSDDEWKIKSENHNKFYYFSKKLFIVCLFMLPIALMPRVETVWKMRLTLLKFHLASPENVDKGVEEIQRIAEKLECKYLGCSEEKKK